MTGYGLSGPMTARGTTFADKDPNEDAGGVFAWSGIEAIEPVAMRPPDWWYVLVMVIGGSCAALL